MKKILLTLITLLLFCGAYSQPYKSQLDKINQYLKTFDNGYYGYFEVIGNDVFLRFKAGKYNKYNVNEMDYAQIQEQYNRVILPCKENKKCIYTDWKDGGGYEEYTQFLQNSSAYNFQELKDLLDNFINALKANITSPAPSKNEKDESQSAQAKVKGFINKLIPKKENSEPNKKPDEVKTLGVKRNLGPNINSPTLTDANPVIAPNGRFLFFSRQSNTTHYDVFISYMQPDGSWGIAQPVDIFNNDKKNQVSYIYPDGNKIILINSYTDEGGFCISHRTSDGWSKPEPIKIDDKITEWDNQNCSLSSDGTRVIISNQRDLYLSNIGKDGTWGKFIKLNGVNSTDNEFTPFLASDNKTLYFSSGGWGGLGSNDIVKSTRLNDSWTDWSKPESIGEPVNTSGWESFFTISAKGDFAIVYKLEEGSGDLFDIKLDTKQKPEPISLIIGNVLDSKTQSALEAEVTYENLTDNITVGKAVTDPKTGQFSIVLQYGKKYAIVAQKVGYVSSTENIDLTNFDEYKEIQKNILMQPLVAGTTIQLNNIFFETGKSELKQESYLELDRLVEIMKQNPKLKIALSGHTDNVGNDAQNLLLSQNRSDAVYKYLVSKSVEKNRLTSKGYGKTKPIADNTTEEGKQKNRRVEFVVVN